MSIWDSGGAMRDDEMWEAEADAGPDAATVASQLERIGFASYGPPAYPVSGAAAAAASRCPLCAVHAIRERERWQTVRDLESQCAGLVRLLDGNRARRAWLEAVIFALVAAVIFLATRKAA
jgi:hypothetical protein